MTTRGIKAQIVVTVLQGLVKAVGISNYGPEQMQKIHAYLQQRGVPLASAQVPVLVSFYSCN